MNNQLSWNVKHISFSTCDNVHCEYYIIKIVYPLPKCVNSVKSTENRHKNSVCSLQWGGGGGSVSTVERRV